MPTTVSAETLRLTLIRLIKLAHEPHAKQFKVPLYCEDGYILELAATPFSRRHTHGYKVGVRFTGDEISKRMFADYLEQWLDCNEHGTVLAEVTADLLLVL